MGLLRAQTGALFYVSLIVSMTDENEVQLAIGLKYAIYFRYQPKFKDLRIKHFYKYSGSPGGFFNNFGGYTLIIFQSVKPSVF